MTDPSASQAGRVTLEALDATVAAIRRTTWGECAFLLVIVAAVSSPEWSALTRDARVGRILDHVGVVRGAPPSPRTLC